MEFSGIVQHQRGPIYRRLGVVGCSPLEKTAGDCPTRQPRCTGLCGLGVYGHAIYLLVWPRQQCAPRPRAKRGNAPQQGYAIAGFSTLPNGSGAVLERIDGPRPPTSGSRIAAGDTHRGGPSDTRHRDVLATLESPRILRLCTIYPRPQLENQQ